MAGRCFQCAQEFGFFKREYDCGNCGKIFCSKCTSKSIVVPGKGKKAIRVCNDCYEIQKKAQEYNKRPQEQSLVYGKVEQNPKAKILNSASNKKGINASFDPDEDIRRRLNKLKEDDTRVSDGDVNSRFKNLTGREPSTAVTSDIHSFGPKKPEVEQTTDLLKQMQDECDIDSEIGNENTYSGVDDIQRRLDKLKGQESKGNTSYHYDSDDEAEFRKRYIQQAIAESFLDDKVRKGGHGDLLEQAERKTASKDNMTPIDPDELPWCCICNEDAVIRCHGCDDDLYCKRCFREEHGNSEYKDHTTSTYTPIRSER